MTTFPALRVHRTDDGVQARLQTQTLEDLPEGEVLIRSAWSDLNYKDALAVTGSGRILRSFPMTAGIDVSGTVAASSDPRFTEGDAVVVTGCGLGEERDGGFAGYVRVPAEAVVPLPEGISLREAMAIGTAGFTAALAVELMERNRQTPEHGPVLVSGATGGVGSLAIDLLAGRGYEVVALTGKAEQADYLGALGAADVLLRDEVERRGRPLDSARWGGAVDNLGGAWLAWMLSTTRPFGNVASIGLAASHTLDTTVMPLILRGVNLLGVNSVLTPRDLRERVWERLSTDLRPRHLDAIVTGEIELDGVLEAAQPMIDGQITGRTLVWLG